MGVSNFRIARMIMLQGLVVGVLGYGIGVGGAALFGLVFATFVKSTPPAFYFGWQIMVIMGGAVAVIVALSALLSSLTGILREAGRKVWCGPHASVHHLAGTWADSVKLTKKEMKPIEARLERSKTLPKYDITIRPKQPRGG